MISHGLWQRRYGGDPGIIGRQVRLEGGTFTVIGIMPADFRLAFPADANVPLEIQAWMPFGGNIYAGPKDLYYLRLLARLKSGVTIEQAQSEANIISEGLRRDFVEYKAENLRLELAPLQRDVVREVRPALIALFIGASLVLAISCFNVANLLLTRATARRREIAVRAALGATRRRIVQYLITESLFICVISGGLGIVIAWAGLKLILSLQPGGLAQVGMVRLNLNALAFASLISLGSGLLAGLAPALETKKVDLVEVLKESGRSGAGLARNRMRTLLIISEVALGFVLLIGAGLMIRTLVQLHRVSPGFNADRVLTFEINLPGAQYRRSADRNNFAAEWAKRLAALPGVEAVGAISHLPFDDYPNWYSPYAPEGFTEALKQNLLADYRATTPDYFRAIGARLINGRDFDWSDQATGRQVVIVDDLLARQTWPGESALGKKLQVEQYTDRGFIPNWAEVVGVVEHIKSHNLLRPLRAQIYLPYPQNARPHLSYVVRVTGNPLAIAPSVRRELDQINKNLALAKVKPLEDYVARAMAPTRFTAFLASIFATLALALATIGIYGVISYLVSQRTHEIGVRMALGARPRDIYHVILREGLLLAAAGLGVGLLASLLLSRYLQSMLFEVTSTDPATYIFALAIVPLAAMLACWKPARRAAAGNPLDALRLETHS
jgi:putative ABC transport system permease protein